MKKSAGLAIVNSVIKQSERANGKKYDRSYFVGRVDEDNEKSKQDKYQRDF